ILLYFLVLSSCKPDENKGVISKKNDNDSFYTLFSQYEKGDSRRYGIFPDSLNNKLHPKTGKSLINSLLDLAENTSVEIKFIKGYYGINLIFDSRKNINLYFDRAEFNLVNITNEGGSKSNNLNLKGTLILYDR